MALERTCKLCGGPIVVGQLLRWDGLKLVHSVCPQEEVFREVAESAPLPDLVIRASGTFTPPPSDQRSSP